jgi:hypothetical protein
LNLFLEWDDDTPFEGIFSKFGIINQPNKNENFNPLPHTRSAIYEREQLYISEDKRSSPYKMEAVFSVDFSLGVGWCLHCSAGLTLARHLSGAGKKRYVAAIVGENGGPERTTHHPQTMRGHSDEDEQASILEKNSFDPSGKYLCL